jgi:hypothetical protein
LALSPGTRLGSYEIVVPLGAGGMGEVYRAHDAKLGRDVAIKVLPPDFVARPEARARFEREARAVAALSHPNILAIHDFGEVDGMAYAVMELLEGETLREALAHGALADGRSLFLLEGQPPRRIVRLDPVSGRREPVREIHPADAGLIGPSAVVVAPDGRSYGANYARNQMKLFLVEGLK